MRRETRPVRGTCRGTTRGTAKPTTLGVAQERHHERAGVETDLAKVLEEVEAEDAVDLQKRRGGPHARFEVGNTPTDDRMIAQVEPHAATGGNSPLQSRPSNTIRLIVDRGANGFGSISNPKS